MNFKKSVVLAMVVLTGCAGSNDYSHSHKDAMHSPGEPKTNQFWWPNTINLSPLRQHAAESSPYNERFNYAKEFKKLNLKEVKKEISKIMKTSQDWWPADYGHYGPFFIRMAWHSAGTYRVSDGRGGAGGGQQRFEPLNSWPDNANLDKARRLLWPLKKKYGKRLSWADIMVLAGNVAMEDMGFETIGFGGGRADDWEPDLVYWGPENKFLERKRQTKGGKLKKPFGATQMGLIYVNPVGPDGKPDPKLAAHAIREAFGQMAMDDEETAALIAGGHSFGKAHGAHKEECLGSDPAGSAIEEQGLGWKNKCGSGKGADTTTSGLEGAWTATPTQWSMQYLEFLYGFEWELTKSPAGVPQWVPKDGQGSNLVPDAHINGKRHAPIMFTTDLALRFDPEYGKITKRWLENPKEFEKAFARAWFKLTHRDMGPKARYVGREVPKQSFDWQDPLPKRRFAKINASEAAQLKSKILATGLSVTDLVKTAWASAASYRGTDMRGGANGARVRLAPQKDWQVNDPQTLDRVIKKLTEVQKSFNSTLSGGKGVSLADVIVLGGAAAIEKAAKRAGISVTVPFKAGRVDASQKQTDVNSFAVLEPKADPFRNYYNPDFYMKPTVAMVDRANLLTLTVPEMTVLVGGMRALGANAGDSKHGIFTERVGTLAPDFFTNLLDMSTRWEKAKDQEGLYIGYDRKTGKQKYTATPMDLAFGSSSELRAIAEVYASNDGRRKFIKDFVAAWSKVMQLDRFDLKY